MTLFVTNPSTKVFISHYFALKLTKIHTLKYWFRNIYSVNKMAKPIEPTPILKGEDAKKFYEELERAESSPSPKKAQFIKECVNLYLKKPF